ncbi:MAG: hypothetical protein RR787_01580, partial [Hydrogenoanaerobacterium sp.]
KYLFFQLNVFKTKKLHKIQPKTLLKKFLHTCLRALSLTKKLPNAFESKKNSPCSFTAGL